MSDLEKVYNQADLQELIDINKEESIHLEFKQGAALKISDSCKNEIAKDVSAFANSDGGIIIYGIEEKNHKASSFSFVDGNSITKEWLDQIISSRIQRKIDGLIIEPIRINGKLENSVYVVKIPMSFNAPHMTSSKRFYKRHNFESLEMEEYEIRELYSRQRLTKLKICDPKISLMPRLQSPEKFIQMGFIISVDVENVSSAIERDFKLEIRIPRKIAILSSDYGPLLPGKVRNEDDYSIYSVPNQNPIFQEDISRICSFDLKMSVNTIQEFIDKKVFLNLFYTNGIERKEICLKDHLFYNGRLLTPKDFE